MNRQMTAIIKKDLRGIASNKRMFSVLLVVPLVLTVFVPCVFLLSLHFIPSEGEDMMKLMKLLPLNTEAGLSLPDLAGLLLNYLMPVFFLLIPIMAASVMAACSFVGEKEKRTLETLLYGPLSLGQIFRAKVAAAFLLSMLVSLLSFGVMLLAVEILMLALDGTAVLPDVKWALVMGLVSPGVSLIAITLIVRGSAKAKSVEDAQQSAVFLVLPVLMLVVGQFTGVLLLSGWLLLGIGVLCAALGALLLKQAAKGFRYEALLK